MGTTNEALRQMMSELAANDSSLKSRVKAAVGFFHIADGPELRGQTNEPFSTLRLRSSQQGLDAKLDAATVDELGKYAELMIDAYSEWAKLKKRN